MTRPRNHETETLEEYHENLFIDRCREDMREGRGITKHRLSKLQDIQKRRLGVQTATSKKEVESR